VDLTVGGTPGAGNRMRRRRVIVVGAVLLAVVASVGGLLLSTTIKSPQQQAAQAAPPVATRLTVPVRRTVITNSVLAQGLVTTPPAVTGPVGGSLPADSVAGSDEQQIVTKILRHPGDSVGQGSVILEVDAQPVFVLAGSQPGFRNLLPGETGSDVAQLQADLESLGYSVGGDTGGVYGAGTAAAVAAFYQAIGFTAPLVTTGPKARRGAWVPLAEVLFVPRLPARVAKLGAKVGGKAGGPLVTLSAGRPAIRGQLSPADRALVRPGMTVRITSPATGRSVTGTVASVGRAIKTTKSISGAAYLSLGVHTDQSVPAAEIGQDVTLSIASARSAGPVLAVPVAAVFAGASGQTYVTKVTGPRSQVRVPVRTGLTGNGLVQVTPAGQASLSPGDQVVTGQDYVQQAGLRGASG
jgi:peptidoglycan hydrolase-like protein with peptidoglycan-binding domain